MADKKNHDNNKTAVALSYNPEENAPKVVAAGKGYLAERILNRAKEADIPVHKDEELAKSLYGLELGEFIPPELYEVVAEILLFVDRMDRIKSRLDGKQGE